MKRTKKLLALMGMVSMLGVFAACGSSEEQVSDTPVQSSAENKEVSVEVPTAEPTEAPTPEPTAEPTPEPTPEIKTKQLMRQVTYSTANDLCSQIVEYT